MKLLDEFLKLEKTSLALTINGKWGSGKTHYVQNKYIEQEQGEINYFYVSLFGLKSPDEINSILFYQLLPFLSPKYEKFIEVGIGIANIATKYFFKQEFIPKEIGDFDLKLLKKVQNGVIFFDDLERYSSLDSIDELLGRINNDFIQNNKFKVVFILNEDSQLNQNDKFLKYKEKIIGWNLKYEPETEKVIGSIIDSYKGDAKFYDLIFPFKDFIIQVLKELEFTNFRTVVFWLDSLKILNNILDLEKLDAIKSFLYSTLILCYEIKEGILTQQKGFESLKIYMDVERYFDSQKPNLDISFDARLHKYKYNLLTKLGDGELFLKLNMSILEFLLNGKFEKERLEVCLDEFSHEYNEKLISPYNKALRKLDNIYTLSENDFDKYISAVIDALSSNSLTPIEIRNGLLVLVKFSNVPELKISKSKIDDLVSKKITPYLKNYSGPDEEFNESFIDKYLSSLDAFYPSLVPLLKSNINNNDERIKKQELLSWKTNLSILRHDKISDFLILLSLQELKDFLEELFKDKESFFYFLQSMEISINKGILEFGKLFFQANKISDLILYLEKRSKSMSRLDLFRIKELIKDLIF
ncbi:MAG: hypothetical protein R2784_02795 [Saprospiraceae bacterium]